MTEQVSASTSSEALRIAEQWTEAVPNIEIQYTYVVRGSTFVVGYMSDYAQYLIASLNPESGALSIPARMNSYHFEVLKRELETDPMIKFERIHI